MNNEHFVFLDISGRRWPRLRRILLVLLVLLLAAMVVFVRILFVVPHLDMPMVMRDLRKSFRAIDEYHAVSQLRVDNLWEKYLGRNRPKQGAAARSRSREAPSVRYEGGEVRAAYCPAGSAAALVDLAKHGDLLTHLLPEWGGLSAVGGIDVEMDEEARVLAVKNGLVLIPVLSNLQGDRWAPENVEQLMASSRTEEQFVRLLVEELKKIDAGGVLLDWQELPAARRNDLTKLIGNLSASLHREGLQLWLSVPMGDEMEAFDLQALSPVVDRFVAQLHDENSESDPPGPVASQDWFEGWLQVPASYGRPEQWIAAIGVYGYDWPAGHPANTIGFLDAMTLARYADVRNIRVDPPLFNPHFEYSDDNVSHKVWFLDATTFLNQRRAAAWMGLGGFALDTLGLEDPSVWQTFDLALKDKITASDLAPLKALPAGENIAHIGDGEFLTADLFRQDGARVLWADTRDRFAASYRKLPAYAMLYHSGAGGPHEVAITFDDGPDPEWTPQVLEILKREGVKAAFFIIGRNGESYPELLRQIVAEGHEIGVHTYTHANLSESSPQHELLELNATQRLIQVTAGVSTALFRPPYNADTRPGSFNDIVPIGLAGQLGYITVCENIDPEDWSLPGADAITSRVLRQRGDGSIVLLHDGGGDRQQTVEALPRLIGALKARGDKIVPLSQLVGIPKDELMPRVEPNADFVPLLVSGAGFGMWRVLEEFLWAFMIVATFLVALRTLFVVVLALVHSRRAGDAARSGFAPGVSVIIAAYNEAKVIEATLRSVLATDYRGELEVIVVDDGSQDDTAGKVRAMAGGEGRLMLLTQANQGKAHALERGFRHASHGILVTLDADTQFQRDTITELVAPFADPGMGAVSGHAKVGNRRRFIARCQALEYACGFNLDRRAYAALNCITVVPGAVGAYRREAVTAVGGIKSDTLAEDTDLTLDLHRAGFRIGYAPRAIAWTEAPETLSALARQRFRWCFGTMQCLWKHRDMVFDPHRGALGFFSLPGIWFFQILLVALVPLVDILLLVSILSGDGGAVLVYFVVFLLADFVLALLGCLLEKEPWHRSLLILPMRFLYRPLLSWVVWKSLHRALQGVFVEWGKLERKGSVEVQSI